MSLSKPTALTEALDRTTFSSGDHTLDGWLRHHALDHQQDRTTNTFVIVDDGRIAGYYCLATAAVERIPGSRWRSRRPTEPVPAMFIGRLAVDLRHQGRGLGARLVRDAVMRALTVHRMVGLPLLLAHCAAPSSRDFYRHLGFREVRFDPYLRALPLRAAAAASAG
ncbi:putative acetyltransferase [Frankia canadensis]|uniref:Putative acetyltransferase n=1 Tax=Frankia canadensis TaxID=1836972 RepID=A0A2I2KSA2_9ACTN|nr:GNAT family N-acetyltransferase [Frankia canadensis]SNQ48547.1 putative acetyltransferase [Frankia canadensis]SOU55837.1 putative acetyltransferase [Frankia canadensis]